MKSSKNNVEHIQLTGIEYLVRLACLIDFQCLSIFTEVHLQGMQACHGGYVVNNRT